MAALNTACATSDCEHHGPTIIYINQLVSSTCLFSYPVLFVIGWKPLSLVHRIECGVLMEFIVKPGYLKARKYQHGFGFGLLDHSLGGFGETDRLRRMSMVACHAATASTAPRQYEGNRLIPVYWRNSTTGCNIRLLSSGTGSTRCYFNYTHYTRSSSTPLS